MDSIIYHTEYQTRSLNFHIWLLIVRSLPIAEFGLTLAHQSHLMMDLYWSNVGEAMVSQTRVCRQVDRLSPYLFKLSSGMLSVIIRSKKHQLEKRKDGER